MHHVKLNETEVEKLKAAKRGDVKQLDSWKLKYLYQRIVALPRGNTKIVKRIGEMAKKYLNDRKEYIAEAKNIFNS